MKVKIFRNTDSNELCEDINKFEEEHLVRATQYEPIYVNSTATVVYTAMVFFEVKK